MTDILSKGLEKLNFETDLIPILSEKMEKYVDEICLYNSAYNLVNTSDRKEIIVRHILDSLSAASEIQRIADDLRSRGIPDITIADIGSGAGFPGIPLAAAFPAYKFVLVERMSKRCAFLENCAIMLHLENVKVLPAEVEKIPPKSFHIAVFRAFRPLTGQMMKTLLSVIVPGGTIAAYKAKKNKIKDEMDTLSGIVKKYTTVPLTVPFLTESDAKEDLYERNLVIIPKQENVPIE